MAWRKNKVVERVEIKWKKKNSTKDLCQRLPHIDDNDARQQWTMGAHRMVGEAFCCQKPEANTRKMRKNTYDTTEIHLRQTHNLFDNCRPTATVYKCLLCIETYQSDMAHQLGSLWIKEREENGISHMLTLKIMKRNYFCIFLRFHRINVWGTCCFRRRCTFLQDIDTLSLYCICCRQWNSIYCLPQRHDHRVKLKNVFYWRRVIKLWGKEKCPFGWPKDNNNFAWYSLCECPRLIASAQKEAHG